MKYTSRANTLLVELLLVILFFMFASMTLVELFGKSKSLSLEAQAINSAVLESQNLAEDLYDSGDPAETLAGFGFTNEGNIWSAERDGYVLQVAETAEDMEGGMLRTMTITAVRDGKTLSTVPSARYLPKEGTP